MEGFDNYKIYLYTETPDYEAEYDTVWGKLHGNIQNQGDLIDLLTHYTKTEETEEIKEKINQLDEKDEEILTSLNICNDKIDEISGKTDVNEQNINELSDTLNSMYDEITEQMAEDFANIDLKIKELSGDTDAKIGEVIDNVSDLNDKLTTLSGETDNKFNDVNEMLTDVKNDISEAKDKINELDYIKDIDFNDYPTKEYADTKYQLKGEYADKDEVEILSGSVEQFKTKVIELSGKTNTNTTDISTLKNDVKYLQDHQEHTVLPSFRTINGYEITGDTSDILIRFDEKGEYIKKQDAIDTFQPKGDYLTEHQSLTEYTKWSTAIATFQPLGRYLTDIKTINGQSLVGEGNIEISGGSGGDLSNYYTKAEVDSKIQGESVVITALTEDLNVLDDKVSSIDDKVAENTLKIENKASKDELEALGNSVATNTNDISALKTDKADKDDVYSKDEIDSKGYLTQHQPLKTINGQSLVGEGNITIQGGGDAYDDTELRNKINSVSGDVQTLKTASGNTYTKTESDNKYQPKGDYALKNEIPDLTNYYTKNQIDAKGYLTEIPSTYAKKTDIPTNISAFNNDSGYITSYTETDPTVPSWAKQPSKPTYTAVEVGALDSNDYTLMDMVGTKADGSTITFKILVKNGI